MPYSDHGLQIGPKYAWLNVNLSFFAVFGCCLFLCRKVKTHLVQGVRAETSVGSVGLWGQRCCALRHGTGVGFEPAAAPFAAYVVLRGTTTTTKRSMRKLAMAARCRRRRLEPRQGEITALL